jgi:hypothetical protein
MKAGIRAFVQVMKMDAGLNNSGMTLFVKGNVIEPTRE